MYTVVFLLNSSYCNTIHISISLKLNRLLNATMDIGIYLSGSTNNLATEIERCRCPTAYNGTSCQDPADGFYRWKEVYTGSGGYSIEQYVGRSVSCDCNGRSEICNKETGHCLMCRENTGGTNCERCAEGFYGDPFSLGCQSCPCPETQRNFARGCTFNRNRVSCLCKPGYAGDLCERCATGYYGVPDVVDGRCEKCDCDPHGIVSNECDELTGQCNCKAGITGRRCDRCMKGKTILQDGHCKRE